jgi:hypothetical protein
MNEDLDLERLWMFYPVKTARRHTESAQAPPLSDIRNAAPLVGTLEICLKKLLQT